MWGTGSNVSICDKHMQCNAVLQQQHPHIHQGGNPLQCWIPLTPSLKGMPKIKIGPDWPTKNVLGIICRAEVLASCTYNVRPRTMITLQITQYWEQTDTVAKQNKMAKNMQRKGIHRQCSHTPTSIKLNTPIKLYRASWRGRGIKEIPKRAGGCARQTKHKDPHFDRPYLHLCVGVGVAQLRNSRRVNFRGPVSGHLEYMHVYAHHARVCKVCTCLHSMHVYAQYAGKHVDANALPASYANAHMNTRTHAHTQLNTHTHKHNHTHNYTHTHRQTQTYTHKRKHSHKNNHPPLSAPDPAFSIPAAWTRAPWYTRGTRGGRAKAPLRNAISRDL